MFAIAMVPGERVCENIKKTWHILYKNYGINFISSNSGLPHITLISGLQEKNKEEIIYTISSSITSKKSIKICSKGLGVFLIETPLVYLRWKNNKQLIELRNILLNNLVKNKLVNNNLNSEWIAKTTICYKDLSYEDNFTNIILTIKGMFTEDFNEEVKRLVLIRYQDSEKEKVIKEFSLKNN
tara:strand:+ start:278 stop:826 length:549 start_codon:yes stop_codon:yes gene_type:complete